MLQEQVVSIALGQGLDTKTDPKVVMNEKLVVLENAVFTNIQTLTKRNGYTNLPTTIIGGGNIVAPTLVKSYLNECVIADQGFLYSFSETFQGWAKKGPYVSTEVSESFLWKETSVGGFVDCAILDNYALYAWSTDPVAGPVATFASLVDLTTGTIILNPIGLSLFDAGVDLYSSYPRCVVLENNILAITYVNHSGAQIVMQILSFSAGGITFGGELVIGTTGLNTAKVSPYDIVPTSTGATFAYANAGSDLTILTIDPLGNIVNTIVIANANLPIPISITLDPSTENAWVYWETSSGSPNGILKYTIVDPTMATILSPTAIKSGLTSVRQVTSSVTSTTVQQVYFSDYSTTDVTTSASVDVLRSVSVQQNGTVGSTSVLLIGAAVYSKSFNVNGTDYMVVYYRGPNIYNSGNIPPTNDFPDPTYFVINCATGYVVARFCSGLAKNLNTLVGQGIASISFISDTKVSFGVGIEFLNLLQVSLVGGLIGAAQVTLDFNSPNSYISKNAGELAILNGGVLSQYDGTNCVELGFHLFPEITWAAQQTSGGLITAGMYSYVAVFQWTDNQGNFHQSAVSLPVSVTTTGSTSSVIMQVTAPYLTQKQNVNVAIFRTQNNGTVYFLVTNPIAVLFSEDGGYYVDFTDTLPDTGPFGIDQNQQIYTTGGVVENSTPPPSVIIEPHSNRLFFVDSENPNTIFYTKSFSPGTGLSPSAFLSQQMDPKFGPISAISEMDDKLVVFKSGPGIMYFSGDGANDVGTGSTFSFPQIIPTDSGCSTLKSVILFPGGIIRQTSKGIYLISRSLNDSYFGMAVQAFNSEPITSATLLNDKNQIRFLTANDTLIYDYVMNQWGTFTNHSGVSSDICNGIYVYARVDGEVYSENLTSFLDDERGFGVGIKTAPIKFANIQGFQRLRRIITLGNFQSTAAGHGLVVSTAYNWSPNFINRVSYLFTGNDGPFQYRERVAIQKCDVIQFIIRELVTESPGETITLSNLAMEIGVKRGVNKLPGSQSVG